MLTAIRTFLAPPVFEDGEKTRVAKLLNLILLSAVGLTLILFVMLVIIKRDPAYNAVMFGITVLMQLGILILMRRGHVRLASVLFTTMAWILLIIVTYFSNGILSNNHISMMTIILVAGLLLGKRGALVYAALSIAFGLGSVLVESLNSLPSSILPDTLTRLWLMDAGNLIIAAVLLSLATREIRESLDSARHELAERKQAEKSLRESELRFRTLAETAASAIVIAQGTQLRYANTAAEALMGYSKEELMSMNIWELIHPDFLEQLVSIETERQDQHPALVRSEIQIIRKDGSTRWVEFAATFMELEGEVASLGIASDISERKRAEEKLRWLTYAVEQSPSMVAITDTDHNVVYVNPRYTEVTGYTTEDASAMYLGDLSMELEEAELKKLSDANASGAEWQGEFHKQKKSGEWYWARVSNSPIKNADGEITHYLEIHEDITERKQAEEAMRQTQKMESLGILAGGVAHDFNNLLVAILGQTSLAQAKLPLNSPARANILKAVSAAQRASDLTRQMLVYSGRGEFEIQPVNLNSLILDNLRLFDAAIAKNVIMRSDLADNLPYIEADAGQMQQLIMNLLLNAAEAIGDQPGTIIVRTHCQTVDENGLKTNLYAGDTLSSGQYVAFELRDNGSGMDEHTLSKIFDPFFTTKFTGRGLGLAAVLGIVRGHHGGLHVDSQIGRGTTFKLLFPASTVKPAALDTEPEHDSHLQGVILVIDDEQPVREVVTDILEAAGVEVMTATDGVTGIRMYRERMADVSLVLLDWSMPGMSSEETLSKIRNINPDARVLLSSGYAQEDATSHFKGNELTGFVQKPYSASTLIKLLRQHMPHITEQHRID